MNKGRIPPLGTLPLNLSYRDTKGWAKMAMTNTAGCGKFSSDRTIQEYVDDIWHLDKIR